MDWDYSPTGGSGSGSGSDALPLRLSTSNGAAGGPARQQHRFVVRPRPPRRCRPARTSGRPRRTSIEELYFRRNIRVQDVAEIMESVYKFKAT